MMMTNMEQFGYVLHTHASVPLKLVCCEWKTALTDHRNDQKKHKNRERIASITIRAYILTLHTSTSKKRMVCMDDDDVGDIG